MATSKSIWQSLLKASLSLLVTYAANKIVDKNTSFIDTRNALLVNVVSTLATSLAEDTTETTTTTEQ